MSEIPSFSAINDALIETLATRFCQAPLPPTVCSDLCATNPNYEFPRSGTNLLTVAEAKEIFSFILKDLVSVPEEHGDWLIWYAAAPIASRHLDWHFAHKDFTNYDTDNRFGSEVDKETCLASIALIEDMNRDLPEDDTDFIDRSLVKIREMLLFQRAPSVIKNLLDLPAQGSFGTPIHRQIARVWLEDYNALHPSKPVSTETVRDQLVKEAWAEVLKRYPDDHAGLVWFASAVGLLAGEIDEEALNWARDVIAAKGLPHASTGVVKGH